MTEQMLHGPFPGSARTRAILLTLAAGAKGAPQTEAPLVSTSPVADQVPSAAPTSASDSPPSTHVTEIVLRPNEGKEVKLTMRKDAP